MKPKAFTPTKKGECLARTLTAITQRGRVILKPDEVIAVRPSQDGKNYYSQTERGQIVIPGNALEILR